MKIKRITIIVPRDCLDDFEHCLRAAGVPGMTIDDVRGFGEHANYFSQDLLMSNVRIEVYLGEARCQEICDRVREFSTRKHTPAGILSVESIEALFDLNSGQNVPADRL
jgi:nitrogen regulatory protein P-II 1